MSDLVGRLLAAIEAKEAKAHGTGSLGWATYRQPDGSMGYTAAVSVGSGVCISDGRVVEPDSVKVVYDEGEVLRRCAADRTIVWAFQKAEIEAAQSRRHDPQVRLEALKPVIEALAEGYGIEGDE